MPRCTFPLQAPLRMEMEGVCNEFLSARVPDPKTISQLRGQNQRERERDGDQRWRHEETPGKTPSFFSSFFTPPLLVPGCQAATMLSWPFFSSIGNSVGPSHEDRRGRVGGEMKEKSVRGHYDGIL